MKYTLRYSGQFKRSYKLCKKRGYDMSKLETVLRLLAETGTLPPKYSAKVVDEDGNVLSTFVNKAMCESYVKLVKIGASYKLMIETDIQKHSYDIYSLPGNGETQDISSNSAPRYSSRKYLHNDQVLIDNNERTYTMHGVEVR